MMRNLTSKLRLFRRNDGGNMTVEAAFLMPFMIILTVILYIIFDAVRQQTVNQKAAYVISDMLSRETTFIDSSYLTQARNMLRYLSSQGDADVTMRVSVLRYSEDDDAFTVQWSKRRGGVAALVDGDMADMRDKLPALSDFEEVIIVETWVAYEPPLNLGFLPREINTFVFNRARFSAQLLWQS